MTNKLSEKCAAGTTDESSGARSGILLLDEDHRILSGNMGIQKIFGYLPEEYVSQDISFFSPEISFEGLAQVTQRSFRFLRKNGTDFSAIIELSKQDCEAGHFYTVLVTEISVNSESQARRTEQLQVSLNEKEALLAEIHHRVKNNLQLIVSLLNIQRRRFAGDPTATLVEELQNRVSSIALLHEMLYQTEDLANIDILEYSRNLAVQLSAYYGKSQTVRLRVEGDPVKLSIERSIPCGLVLNELITNCLLHGFPHGKMGEIRIEVREDAEEMIQCSVKDNGIGLPEKCNPQTAKSLGLELIRKLTNQLQGQVEFDRGSGLKVTVYFRR